MICQICREEIRGKPVNCTIQPCSPHITQFCSMKCWEEHMRYSHGI